MEPDIRRARLNDVFDRAHELPTSERAAFIEQACADDAQLLAEVRNLLRVDTTPAEFLDSPISPRGLLERMTAPSEAPQTLVGRRIGRYAVEAVIGTGGMGIVYHATQDAPRRVIALKVMNTGAASAWQRFRDEAETLGRMEHPGIAAVYEAGVHESGDVSVPYMAMQLIPGARSLTRFAQDQQLGIRQKLKLMVQVCDAIHHAHQRGIIHRDLKPANILVDQEGASKIVDFGIAKAVGGEAGSSLTGRFAVIGTLAYMSPEQVNGSANVDVRSDVYALGVVLYELLAGRPPFDLTDVPIPEAARIIGGAEPIALGTLDPALRGDIETIIGKAMEKQRDRRYQSAAELGNDIERCLSDQPILAHPPSVIYRTRKFIRRNPVGATLAVTALIAVAASIVAYEARRASIASSEAASRATEQARQRAVLDAARDLASTAVVRARENPELAGLLAMQAYAFNESFDPAFLASGDAMGEVSKALRELAPDSGWNVPLKMPDGLTVYRLAHSTDWQLVAGAGTRGKLERPIPGDGGVVVWDLTAPGGSRPQAIECPRLVTWVGFSPDRKWLVGASPALRDDANGRLFLWDRDLVLRHTIEDVPNVLGCSLTFNPTNSRLAGCSPKGRVWVASLPEGFGGNGELLLDPPLFRQSAYSDELVSFSWSADGRWLAGCAFSSRILLWDMNHPEREAVRLSESRAEDPTFATATFTSDSLQLWSVDPRKGEYLVWDLASISANADRPDRVTNSSSAFGNAFFSFGPGGRRAVSNMFSNAVRLWDAERPDTPPINLTGHRKRILQMLFNPEGSQLFTCALDGVRQWDLGGPSVSLDTFSIPPTEVLPVSDSTEELGGMLAKLGMVGGIRSLAFDPSGSRLAAGTLSSGQASEKLFVWNLTRPGDVPTIRRWTTTPSINLRLSVPSIGGINALAYSQRGALLAAASGKTIRLFDPLDPNDAGIALSTDEGIPLCLAFAPTGDAPNRILISGNDAGILVVTVLGVRATLRTATAHKGAIRSIAVSSRDSLIASGGDDKLVRVCSIGDPQHALGTLEGHTARINAVCFSPSGEMLASASDDGSVRLWNQQNGWKQTRLISTPDAARALAFDSSGDFLFIGIGPKLRGAENFAPDIVDSIQTRGSVRLVDLRLGRESCAATELPGDFAGVSCLALTPDGMQVAAGTDDLHIKLWPSTPPAIAQKIAKRLSRSLTESEWAEYVKRDLPYQPWRPESSGTDRSGAP